MQVHRVVEARRSSVADDDLPRLTLPSDSAGDDEIDAAERKRGLTATDRGDAPTSDSADGPDDDGEVSVPVMGEVRANDGFDDDDDDEIHRESVEVYTLSHDGDATATTDVTTTDGYSMRSSDAVVTLSNRGRASSQTSPIPPRSDSKRPSNATPSIDRKRSHPSRITADERTGFARIYFENKSFTSSTVFKLTATMTVREVRQSMANRMKIHSSDFDYYVIVVVFPNDNGARLSARTLKDHEPMLPIVERLHRMRSSTTDSEEALSSLRPKPKHRSRPPVKFVLKDVRGPPLNLEEEHAKSQAPESTRVSTPVFLGKGVRSGYLQKASLKDPNVWRRRWFVIKNDQLLYCKSATNQRDVTAISLLNTRLAKGRAQVHVPHSFELHTPRRVYQLCANSKEDMSAWVQALHMQIEMAADNHGLFEAEVIITEDAVLRSEEESLISPLAEPSLLQRVMTRDDTWKCFRDFAYCIGAKPLLDTWIECENFRRNCIEREIASTARSPVRQTLYKRSAREEWDHLKAIVGAMEALPMISADEVAQLRQSFQTEHVNRRLSMALHADTNADYPRVDIIASVHQKILEAIESGPFKQFLMRHGYRLLLEKVVGRVI
ncbi:hypothetical protein PINS_up021985 [Pythium insidiosum]|nr:hypothetical protein PINS_up021985 [Pythium insidiosum]